MEQQNNLNAMLIDQQVLGIVNAHKDLFPAEKLNDFDWMKSAAFVLLTAQCVLDVENALSKLYNNRGRLSLQQLSATFRRGDLIDALGQAATLSPVVQERV